MKRNHAKLAIRLISIGFVVVFVLLTYRYFEGHMFLSHFRMMTNNPDKLAIMFAIYGASFWLRALAWKWYVGKNIPLTVYLKGLLMSLFINHLVPVKVGDIVRIAILAKQKEISIDESVHSVAVMRILDMLILFLFSACGAYVYLKQIPFHDSFLILLGVGGIAAIVLRKWNSTFIHKHVHMFMKVVTGRLGLCILGVVALSWFCEAIMIYEISKVLGMSLSIFQSVWVNSVTVSGQVFQMAPGGLATYEAVMAFAITRLVPIWDQAYTAALLTHAFKFIFSYIVGIVLFLKSPRDIWMVRSWLKKKEVGNNEKSIKI